MRISRACAALVIAVAGMSCDDHEAFDAAVLDAKDDVAKHSSKIDASSTMRAARDELDRHDAEVHADIRRIRRHLSDLDGDCDSYDLDWVWGEEYAIEGRIDAYLSNARDTSGLSPLQASCDRYARDVSGMFDELRYRVYDARCW